MDENTKNELAATMVKNGIDWYALLLTDGTTDLRHQTGLSSILQCGHDPADYDIEAMYQCGYADTIDEALEQIDNN